MSTDAVPSVADLEAEAAAARPPSPRAATWWWVVAVATGLAAVTMLFLDLPREVIGLLTIVLMVLLMCLRVPVAIAMIGAGIVGAFVLGGERVVAQTLTELPFKSVASWTLSVLPTFVLMGSVLYHSGLTGGVFRVANRSLRRVPGGVAVATNFSGAIMASASGSTIGISYALGRVALPEMLKLGYDRRLATGVVAMVGTLGQLIPPSILLVVYASIASIAVGPQLAASLVPGLLIALAFAVVIVARVIVRPALAPRRADGTPEPIARDLLTSVLPLGVLLTAVFVGLYSGVFTATEAGAIAAAGAAVVGLVAHGPKGYGRRMLHALRDSAAAVASLFVLFIGVAVLNRAIGLSRATEWLVSTVENADLSRVAFLLLLAVVYLILGLALEPLAMMLLTVPVLLPLLTALDIDLFWFGVYLVILCEVAIVSPPVGVLVFIVHKLARDPAVGNQRDMSLTDVYRGVGWFVAAICAVLALLIAFPGIALWLPSILP